MERCKIELTTGAKLACCILEAGASHTERYKTRQRTIDTMAPPTVSTKLKEGALRLEEDAELKYCEPRCFNMMSPC
jgi:hypothetical protein